MGVSGVDPVNYSLNEIELLAKRAARGGGYCWSLAEEAGKATRWLCAHDVDGVKQLALLLQRGFAANSRRHRPQQIRDIWRGDDILCPIMTGCLLSDCAARLRAAAIQTGHVAIPALLLPFAAAVARITGAPVTISADGWQAEANADELYADAIFPQQTGAVRIQTRDQAGGASTNPRRRQTRAMPEPASLTFLERLAHKTYAPATEESRRLGAG